jgi:hypothetical protein
MWAEIATDVALGRTLQTLLEAIPTADQYNLNRR